MEKSKIQTNLLSIAIPFLLTCLGGCGEKSKEANVAQVKTPQTVCVAQYVSHPALDQAYDGFKEEMAKLGFKKNQIIFKNAAGDANAVRLLADQYCSQSCDAILALATPMAQKINSSCPNKPLVFSAITDPISAGLVTSMDKPGANATGTSDQWPYAMQMELIAYLWGDNASVGVPYNPSEANTTYAINEVKKYALQYRLNLVSVPINNSSEAIQSVDALKGRVSVIYIPADNTAMAAAKGIITNAHRIGIPVVAGDPGTFEAGADIGLGVSYRELGKQNAQQIQQFFSGKPIGTLPVAVSGKPKFFINMERLKNMGTLKDRANTWMEQNKARLEIN